MNFFGSNCGGGNMGNGFFGGNNCCWIIILLLLCSCGGNNLMQGCDCCSLILLILGFYRPMMDSATAWGKEILGVGVEQSWSHLGALLGMIFAFGMGCLIGVVLISKIMKVLLDKFHDVTYFAIIGFVLGSILVLFFNYDIFNYYLYWAGVIVEGVKTNPIMPIYIEIPVGLLLLGVSAFLSYLLVKHNRSKEVIEE